MKFYSEKLNRVFNTVEELNEAEIKKDQKDAEKTAAKNKIKKSINTICKEFNSLIDFLEKDEHNWTDAEEEEILSEFFTKFFPLISKIRLM